MKCSDRNLGEEQLFERIDKYLCGELSENEDRDFTEHIMECQSCYETLLIQQLTKRIVSNYEDQIFPEVKESPEEGEKILTQEPMQERKPTLWLMLNNAVMREIKFRPEIPWTTELSKPGLYSLINQEKKILYKIKYLPEAAKGVSVRGGQKDSLETEARTIQIPLLGSSKKGELTITAERRGGRYFLTLLFKKPNT